MVMAQYERLVREIQEKTGKNQSELARLFGVSQPTVSRWLQGTPPELEHADTISKVAVELRIINNRSTRRSSSVPIVGYVGAGGTVDFSQGQGPFGEAKMPPDGAPGLVAVRVVGDSMSGALEDGWTVYYENRREPPDETLHGKLCIVGLADGRVLIKKLYPGRKIYHFDLHSMNLPPMLDQRVDWAARITWIAPT